MELLEQLSRQKVMNRETLQNFYQDFMQMLYAQMNEEGRALGSIYATSEAMELYQSATRSVRQMQDLIHYTMGRLEEDREPEEMLRDILTVTPERVVEAAKTVRLDTVYFLTGKEEGDNG